MLLLPILLLTASLSFHDPCLITHARVVVAHLRLLTHTPPHMTLADDSFYQSSLLSFLYLMWLFDHLLFSPFFPLFPLHATSCILHNTIYLILHRTCPLPAVCCLLSAVCCPLSTVGCCLRCLRSLSAVIVTCCLPRHYTMLRHQYSLSTTSRLHHELTPGVYRHC